jgi:hypothetical protein
MRSARIALGRAAQRRSKAQRAAQRQLAHGGVERGGAVHALAGVHGHQPRAGVFGQHGDRALAKPAALGGGFEVAVELRG